MDTARVVAVDTMMIDITKIFRQIYKLPTCFPPHAIILHVKRELDNNLTRKMVQLHETASV